MDSEQEREIIDLLREVAKVSKGAPADQTIRQMARRVSRYYSLELFRLIWKIPEEAFFPTPHILEMRVRKMLNLEPTRGMSPDMIEQNSEQLLKEGVKPEVVEAGARFLRRVIGEEVKHADPIVHWTSYGEDGQARKGETVVLPPLNNREKKEQSELDNWDF